MADKRIRERKKMKYKDPRERAKTHVSGNESMSVRLPEGMKFFAVKAAKTHKIDVLPYEVKKGKEVKGGNPYCESGFAHYERTYWSHPRIGPDNKTICCPRMTFGKKCPVCEDQARMRKSRDADSDAIKALEPKERQIFAVRESNSPDEVQIWDISFHLFGKVLDAKLKDSEEDDGYENFFNAEGGSTLRVGFEEKSMGSGPFYSATNIEIKPRKEDIPQEILDQVPDLDSLLVELDYKTVEKIYLGLDDDAEEEDTPKNGKKSPPPDDEDDEDEEDEDLDEDEDEDDPPAKKAPPKKAPPKKLTRAEEEEEDDEDDLDEDDEDDEEDDPPPVKKGKTPPKKTPAKKVEDDEDDWDSDDEDEDEEPDEEDDDPPPAKKAPAKRKR